MPESIKVVYDTNIIASATLTHGIPWLTLQLFVKGKVNLYVSSDLLEEYRRVLRRPKFQRTPNLPMRTLEIIERRAIQKDPSFKLNVALHEPDNRVVECAVEAKTHYIVTGNKRHFPFSAYKGIKIVSPREFMQEVAPDWLRSYEYEEEEIISP